MKEYLHIQQTQMQVHGAHLTPGKRRIPALSACWESPFHKSTDVSVTLSVLKEVQSDRNEILMLPKRKRNFYSQKHSISPVKIWGDIIDSFNIISPWSYSFMCRCSIRKKHFNHWEMHFYSTITPLPGSNNIGLSEYKHRNVRATL